MKKRARIEIIADILFLIRKNRKARFTNILYKANLSVQLLNKYLDALLKDELIAKIKNIKGRVYCLTKKGFKFIGILQELNSMVQFIEIHSDRRTV